MPNEKPDLRTRALGFRPRRSLLSKIGAVIIVLGILQFFVLVFGAKLVGMDPGNAVGPGVLMYLAVFAGVVLVLTGQVIALVRDKLKERRK